MEAIVSFRELFPDQKAFIACVHLAPLPGAPGYRNSFDTVIERALAEAEQLVRGGAGALIMENFGDAPFFPSRVPVETVASMAVIAAELRRQISVPLGINVLRNDGEAALAIATAARAEFIRVNVLMHAAVGDQGLLEGRSYAVQRLKRSLNSSTLIFADVAVKHAVPLGERSLSEEVNDLENRGLVDGLIVSGAATGSATDPSILKEVSSLTDLPVLVGSGVTPKNLSAYTEADGWIVGSCLKVDNRASQAVQESKVKEFSEAVAQVNGRSS